MSSIADSGWWSRPGQVAVRRVSEKGKVGSQWWRAATVWVGGCACVGVWGERVECQARSFVGGRVKQVTDGRGTGHDCTAGTGVRGVWAC